MVEEGPDGREEGDVRLRRERLAERIGGGDILIRRKNEGIEERKR